MGYDPNMIHMPDRDRIARAEEAAIDAKQRAAKAAKKAGSSKRPKPEARMKVVWEVCDGGNGKVAKSFPYPDKAQAEAEVAARSRSTGRSHILRPTKVPMDQ